MYGIESEGQLLLLPTEQIGDTNWRPTARWSGKQLTKMASIGPPPFHQTFTISLYQRQCTEEQPPKQELLGMEVASEIQESICRLPLEQQEVV